MNIETTFYINSKNIGVIDDLLNNGKFELSLESNDKTNHIEITDVQWDTPYIFPLQGGYKTIVTFNLEAKPKVRTKKLLKEVILKYMFLHINKKKTKVNFIHFND